MNSIHKTHKGFQLVSYEGADLVLKKTNSFGDLILRIIDFKSEDFSNYIELVFQEGSWPDLGARNIRKIIRNEVKK